MKTLLSRATVLLLAAPVWIFGQTANTTVADTIIGPGPTNPTGTITLSWQRTLNDASPRQVIYPGSQIVPVTNGAFSVSLFPNDAQLPISTCYQAAYHLGINNSIRYWRVPTSPTSVNLQQVEGNQPCPTQIGAIIAPAQINPGAAGLTQVLTSSPTGLVSWVTGGGGGGGTPGGSTGQLQFNNSGSFGGFTPGGDVTFTRPNFNVVSTGGVAFAPSATVNALNASNISSGTLAPSVGGTGAGAFTTGSVPFVGAGGVYAQNNANLFWNNSTVQLGIGTAAPTQTLDVNGSGRIASSSTQGILYMSSAGTAPSLGYGAVSNSFTFGDTNNYYFATNTSTGNTSIGGVALAGIRLDVQSSGASGTFRVWDQTATTGTTQAQFRNGASQGSGNSSVLFGTTSSGVGIWYINDIGIGAFRDFSDYIAGAALGPDFNGLKMQQSYAVQWNSGTTYSSATDTELARTSSGIVEINNGTTGHRYGTSLQTGSGLFFDNTPSTGITNVRIQSGAGQAANDLVDAVSNLGVLLGGISPQGESFTTDGAGHFIAQAKYLNGFRGGEQWNLCFQQHKSILRLTGYGPLAHLRRPDRHRYRSTGQRGGQRGTGLRAIRWVVLWGCYGSGCRERRDLGIYASDLGWHSWSGAPDQRQRCDILGKWRRWWWGHGYQLPRDANRRRGNDRQRWQRRDRAREPRDHD